MSEIYNFYESNFKIYCQKIESILNKEEFNQKSISELSICTQEINKIFKQMSLEINNLKTTKKKVAREIEQKLKQYKTTVDNYNLKLIEIKENFNKKPNINIEMSNKNILIDDDINPTNQGLIEEEYAQQEKLNYIGRRINDIEHLGNEISTNLNSQTEQMRNVRDDIFVLRNDADASNNLIIKLLNQAKRNKMIMYGCIVLIALIFIMAMIYKFKY